MIRKLFINGKNLVSREQSNILSAALVIMITVLLSALLGVIRNRLLISYFYENADLLDVYWAAFRLPDMVFQLLIVGALSAAFIPVYSDVLTKNKYKANAIASSVINNIMLILISLSVFIIIFAPQLSSLIVSGFTQSQLDLMTSLTRIMISAQVFFGLSSFMTGIIQSHQRFLIPALSPLLYNFGIILGTVTLSQNYGIYGPSIGVVIGALLHLIFQIPLTRKLGFKYSFSWNLKDPAVKKIRRLMIPRTLTLSVNQIEQTAMVFFASALTSGSLTMIYIAQQLSNLPTRIFGIPIGQASLPFFSRLTANNQLKELAKLINNALLEIVFLALPSSVIVLVLRIPLVRLAYGAKDFPWAATVTTGKLVAILSISIVARSLTHLIVRAFYALQNTKTPLLVAVASMILNISLSYFFIFILQTGILGLAVAMSVSALLEASLLIALLYIQSEFKLSNLLKPLAKMLIVSIITAVSLWVPLRLLDQLIFDTTRTIPLILLTLTVFCIGLSIYILLSRLFGIKQLSLFAKMLRKIGDWQKALSKTTEPLETTEAPL